MPRAEVKAEEAVARPLPRGLHTFPRSVPQARGRFPLTLPHAGATQGLSGSAEAQLPTHHTGCLQVPLSVTDRSPRAGLQHFHSAFSGVGTTLETHTGLQKKDMPKEVNGNTGLGSPGSWMRLL